MPRAGLATPAIVRPATGHRSPGRSAGRRKPGVGRLTVSPAPRFGSGWREQMPARQTIILAAILVVMILGLEVIGLSWLPAVVVGTLIWPPSDLPWCHPICPRFLIARYRCQPPVRPATRTASTVPLATRRGELTNPRRFVRELMACRRARLRPARRMTGREWRRSRVDSRTAPSSGPRPPTRSTSAASRVPGADSRLLRRRIVVRVWVAVDAASVTADTRLTAIREIGCTFVQPAVSS
jgi:hypothetical protein